MFIMLMVSCLCVDGVMFMCWWYHVYYVDGVMFMCWWCHVYDVDGVMFMCWWCQVYDVDGVMFMMLMVSCWLCWWCHVCVLMVSYLCVDGVMFMWWWCHVYVLMVSCLWCWWCHVYVLMAGHGGQWWHIRDPERVSVGVRSGHCGCGTPLPWPLPGTENYIEKISSFSWTPESWRCHLSTKNVNYQFDVK